MAKYQRYNSRRVRRFLKTAFPTTEELSEFCHDYYDEVLASFGDGMSLRQMINALFNRCHDDSALEGLLECCRECLIEENKEDIWARFAPFEKAGYVSVTPTRTDLYESEEERFFKALMQLNYRQEVKIFRQFLAVQQPISFLIRGPRKHGQRLLLNQLYQCLPDSTSSKRIERSLRRNGRSRRIKFLWRELGEEVGVESRTQTQSLSPFDRLRNQEGEGREAIAHRIHDYLQSQHLILIFNDACLTEKGYLSQLMQEFWYPLLDELARIKASPPRTHQLIMFIVDYQAQADLQGVDWIETFHGDSTPHVKYPVKFELSAFCETDVKGWFDSHAYRVLPSRLIGDVDQIIHDLLKIKVTESIFVPEQTLEEICHCCGYDWIEGEDRWFKL